MEKCLITKLNASVKADVPFLEGIRFYYQPEVLDNADCTFTYDNIISAIVRSFDSDYNKLQEITCKAKDATNLAPIFSTGTMGVVSKKSGLRVLIMNRAGTAVPNNFCINLDDLKGMNLEDLRLDRNYSQDGDIAKFSDMENLSLLWVNQTSVGGKIENLKNMKALTTFGALELSNVEGDFGLFIQNMRDCGRTTGTISCLTGFWTKQDFSKKLLYYNGKRIDPLRSDAGVIYWESDKSYVKKGIQVFCDGYSSDEITTNTATGGIWEGCTVTSVE